MKGRSKFAAAAIMVLLVISLSLNIVSALNQTPVPGSDQDPIVSKSYVDAAFEKLVTEIQKLVQQNEELKAKTADQDKKIKALQDEISTLKSGAASPQTSSGSGDKKPGDQTAAQPSTKAKGVVNTAVLNLRSQPNTSSSILAKLYKNETVTIESESNGWYKVTTSKGKVGYVFSIYVTKK
jgi:hypothetical protein